MYPSEKLNAIALRKQVLRRRISRQRYQCRELVEEVARPFVWAKPWVGRLFTLWTVGKAFLPCPNARSSQGAGWFSLVLKALPVVFRLFPKGTSKTR